MRHRIRGVALFLLAHGASLACDAPTDTIVRQGGIVDTGATTRGRLVFPLAGDTAGTYRIYAMRADGTGLTPITPSGGYDYAPAWSPDGSLIAYERFSPNDQWAWSVSIVRPDGTGRRDLAEGQYPVWLADGRIAYECMKGMTEGVCVIDANGANATVLLSRPLGDDISYTLSPDGSLIAFERMVDNDGREDDTLLLPTNIYIMRRDGSGERRLTATDSSTTSESSPAWSPDGRRIAFVSMSLGVVVADADGGRLHSITPENGLLWRGASDPVWSPDGTKVLFNDGHGTFYIANADGSGAIRRVEPALPAGYEPFGPMSWSNR